MSSLRAQDQPIVVDFASYQDLNASTAGRWGEWRCNELVREDDLNSVDQLTFNFQSDDAAQPAWKFQARLNFTFSKAEAGSRHLFQGNLKLHAELENNSSSDVSYKAKIISPVQVSPLCQGWHVLDGDRDELWRSTRTIPPPERLNPDLDYSYQTEWTGGVSRNFGMFLWIEVGSNPKIERLAILRPYFKPGPRLSFSAGGGQATETVTLTAFFNDADPDNPNISFNPSAGANRVVFIREVEDGETIEAQAEVIEASRSTLRVKVPVKILGDREGLVQPPLSQQTEGIRVRVTVSDPEAGSITGESGFTLIWPRHLIVDEVMFPPLGVPSHLLPQFILEDDEEVETFFYFGRSTDGWAGLRVLNTIPLGVRDSGESHVIPPLILDNQPEVYFPNSDNSEATGVLPLLGLRNAGDTFNITQTGLYVISVSAHEDSEFPAPFQIHLSANVGHPQKIINGEPEPARGLRQDLLFNHPAARPESLPAPALDNPKALGAFTSLVKFADGVEASPFALSVIQPPLMQGTAVTRAADPAVPLSVTTPTARSPGCSGLDPGMALDFTQVPDPAVVNTDPTLGGSICSVIGQTDGFSTQSNVILDLGAGSEAVNGEGADLEIVATGSYSVWGGNVPYTDSMALIGSNSGVKSFDLAGSGLSTVRYLHLEGAAGLAVDAVKALHFLADGNVPDVGPILRRPTATVIARRLKHGSNHFDPFIELIGPDGQRLRENESGFRDLLSPNRSDAAMIDVPLPTSGFYRVLAKGYHQAPDLDSLGEHEFIGSVALRLETGGNFDTDLIDVSPLSESDTAPQKQGTISRVYQRDSYLFQAMPGSALRISVDGHGEAPLIDPVVELYDPESFLIAANDNASGRGRNALISLNNLPQATANGTSLAGPQTYRLVVSGVDVAGATQWEALRFPDCTAHQRVANGGDYEVRVFQGNPSDGGGMPGPPILEIRPASLTFGQVTVGIPKARILTLRNAGETTLNIDSIRIIEGPDFVVDPTSLSIPPGAETEIEVTFTPTTPGDVSPSIELRSDDPQRPSITLGVSALAVDAPDPGGADNIAEARLVSLSLWMQKSAATVNGEEMTLRLTSDEELLHYNGELGPAEIPPAPSDLLQLGHDTELPSHGSLFTVFDASGDPWLSGYLELNLPPARDENDNGLPDFFELESMVDAIAHDGVFFEDSLEVEGSIQTSWQRDANQATGQCQISLAWIHEGVPLEVTFTPEFGLIAYEGPFTYRTAPNGAPTGELLANSITPHPSDLGSRFEGSLSPEIVSADELAQAGGAWADDQDGNWPFAPFNLTRKENRYLGLVYFEREHFIQPSWMLHLLDENDGDDNGVPDLSDPVAGPGTGEPMRLPNPTIVEHSPAFSGDWGITHIFDGDPTTDYASAGAGTDTMITFDLGSLVHLTEIHYTDRGSSGGGNGSGSGGSTDNVTQFQLTYSVDEVFGNEDDSVQIVASPGHANTDVVATGGVDARYLRWEVLEATGANVGAAEFAFYTMQDNTLTIDAWRTMHFEDEDSAEAQDLANPDNDPYPNVFEYFFGTDPTQSEAAPPIHVMTTSESHVLQFPRNARATGITLVVESSDSLHPNSWTQEATWTRESGWGRANASPFNVSETSQENQPHVNVVLPRANANGQTFLRLRLSD